MGWKETTVNKGGQSYSYPVYQQHDINNCGPSSIVMTVNQALDRRVAIGFAQMVVGKAEQASGKRNASRADARWHSWDNSSTGGYSNLDDLKTAMNNKWPGLNATDLTVNATHPEQLAACRPDKPALTHVAWTNGGGHFIVCLGKAFGSNDILFLDPYYGVVVCDYFNYQGTALRYGTQYNSFGKGTAWAWSSWAIYTNP